MDDVVCKHGWSRRFCEPCSSAHIIAQLKGPRDMGMLAIKPENVPDAVWHTAMSTYHKAIKKRPGSAWQEAIAAALNAWPGMKLDYWSHIQGAILLPLAQKQEDGDA